MIDLHLESLHLLAVVSHRLGLLMSGSVFNNFDNFRDLRVLFLKCLKSVFLTTILSYKVLHQRLRLNIYKILLQLNSELVNKLEELRPDAHNHFPNVVFPHRKIWTCASVFFNSLFGLFPNHIKILKWRDVALVDVLHVLLVDETRKAFKSLLLAGIEVEACSMDITALA